MRYQEQCSCGAVLTCRRYSQLVHWRDDHFHEMPVSVEPIQVPPSGGESHTEIHPENYFFSDDGRRRISLRWVPDV